MWPYHQFLPEFLAKDHLTRVARQLANDKDDNEVKPGTVHRLSRISLTAEENPGKSQLGDRLMKAVRQAIVSNRVPCLQMRSVGSHCTSRRETEGKKERTGGTSL